MLHSYVKLDSSMAATRMPGGDFNPAVMAIAQSPSRLSKFFAAQSRAFPGKIAAICGRYSLHANPEVIALAFKLGLIYVYVIQRGNLSTKSVCAAGL